MPCSDTDGKGRKLLGSGAWNTDSQVHCTGGQVIHFAITNINVVGTTIEISEALGEANRALILPGQTVDLNFSRFGDEPMDWSFDISTQSDAFMVTYCLYSTWVPTTSPHQGC